MGTFHRPLISRPGTCLVLYVTSLVLRVINPEPIRGFAYHVDERGSIDAFLNPPAGFFSPFIL
jgi:hypothetical protein